MKWSSYLPSLEPLWSEGPECSRLAMLTVNPNRDRWKLKISYFFKQYLREEPYLQVRLHCGEELTVLWRALAQAGQVRPWAGRALRPREGWSGGLSGASTGRLRTSALSPVQQCNSGRSFTSSVLSKYETMMWAIWRVSFQFGENFRIGIIGCIPRKRFNKDYSS